MNPQHAESREYSMSEAPDDIEDPSQRAAWALGADRGHKCKVCGGTGKPAEAPANEGGDERTLRDRAKARWMAEPGDTSLLEAYDRGWKDRALAAPAQGDEVIPPRPAGYNDASTDPGSPLQRWGKPRHEGAKLLLQPLDDGYWTPWHIANEMLRSAQSGDEAQLLADWVCERWHAEVAGRPLVNVHRRTLDDTWRQMLRHLGVDDEARLGPRHDDLLAARAATGGAKS